MSGQHREVGVHTRSFASALRGALREDPDILLVGELRDMKRSNSRLTAAATDTLSLALCIPRAHPKRSIESSTFSRPTSKTRSASTLSESLKGVVAQNLFKRIDKPGRVAALEILVVDVAIANLMREAKTHQIPGMIQVGKKKGNQPWTTPSWITCATRASARKKLTTRPATRKKFRQFLKEPPADMSEE